MKKVLFLSIPLAALLLSCNQENNSAENKTTVSADQQKQNLWAEQIEANTSLVRPEGWAEEDWQAVNKNVDHKKIFNTITEAVNKGQQKAYDFFTDSAYTMDEAKSRLENLKSEDISAIRTREIWNFDQEKFKLEKQVTRIYLFTKKLDENGEYMGDKALFYVKLNN